LLTPPSLAIEFIYPIASELAYLFYFVGFTADSDYLRLACLYFVGTSHKIFGYIFFFFFFHIGYLERAEAEYSTTALLI
jgi:hypothetical protein